jgi:hypothetical protein
MHSDILYLAVNAPTLSEHFLNNCGIIKRGIGGCQKHKYKNKK